MASNNNHQVVFFRNPKQVSTVTGIQANGPVHTGWEAYPNPSNNSFVISTHTSEPQNMQIVDASGRVVLNRMICNECTIETGNLNPGIYVMTLTSAKGVLTKRISVIH